MGCSDEKLNIVVWPDISDHTFRNRALSRSCHTCIGARRKEPSRTSALTLNVFYNSVLVADSNKTEPTKNEQKEVKMTSPYFRQVERLLEHRETDDHFLVKWLGRPADESSWEPKSTIPDDTVAAWLLSKIMGSNIRKPPPLPAREDGDGRTERGNVEGASPVAKVENSGRGMASFAFSARVGVGTK